MMDSVCFVNFNARLYDPSLGRFMSADSVTQTVYNLQALNRYSYVLNDPLSLTDPSGNCTGVFGCIGDVLLDLFTLKPLIPIIRSFPILGDIIIIGEGIACGPFCAAAASAEITGFTTGNVGEAFKAFAITLAEAEAFNEIGNLHLSTATSFTALMESATLHGFVGGLTSVAQGGKFGSGFIAAAVSDIAAPDPNTTPVALGTAEAAIAGGVGSVLGGGKFANGAVTGAFGYLFNSCAHTPGCVNRGPGSVGQNGKPLQGFPSDYLVGGAAAATIAGPIVDFFGFVKAFDWLTGTLDFLPRPEGIPDEWIEKPTDTPGGMQYTNPENSGDSVRVMPANPNSPNTSQQVPYVIDNLDGQYLTTSGGRVQGPANTAETHIPLSSYKFGR